MWTVEMSAREITKNHDRLSYVLLKKCTCFIKVKKMVEKNIKWVPGYLT